MIGLEVGQFPQKRLALRVLGVVDSLQVELLR
jgi:hypothetical protein